MEADSLNCCVLGEDVTPDQPEFALFVREVVREMTTKDGQKCTAIRRIIVPPALVNAVSEYSVEGLPQLVGGCLVQGGG
ncbi:oxepin-CoA hydrolase and 3-oxo-5,6-dehydrosuberyl-CoA semialdehyde dehydrogenase [Escherichia coli]|nr:oxepin-CoA hydrolase and 3-oxo-5,6-dehydrosuberyl-CoA semialdehyde dehydrogenase [Escherichia coli]